MKLSHEIPDSISVSTIQSLKITSNIIQACPQPFLARSRCWPITVLKIDVEISWRGLKRPMFVQCFRDELQRRVATTFSSSLFRTPGSTNLSINIIYRIKNKEFYFYERRFLNFRRSVYFITLNLGKFVHAPKFYYVIAINCYCRASVHKIFFASHEEELCRK